MVTGMLPLLIILAIPRITKAECDEVNKTTENDGFIKYKSTKNRNCTWTLVDGPAAHNILIFDLRDISLWTDFLNKTRVRGILKLPGSGGIVSLGPTHCYVYMLSSGECDIPSIRKKIRAGMKSCEIHFFYSDIKQLPWNNSISLQSFLPGPKSFTLFYRYGKCVQTRKQTTGRKSIIGRPDSSPSSGTQMISYPIVVSILTCLLFISIGVILWIQVKQKKLAAEYLSNHTSRVAMSPSSCVTPTQDGDIGVYQMAAESTLPREPCPTYAEINGAYCNGSVVGSIPAQENKESDSPTTQSVTPVYAKVNKVV